MLCLPGQMVLSRLPLILKLRVPGFGSLASESCQYRYRNLTRIESWCHSQQSQDYCLFTTTKQNSRIHAKPA